MENNFKSVESAAVNTITKISTELDKLDKKLLTLNANLANMAKMGGASSPNELTNTIKKYDDQFKQFTETIKKQEEQIKKLRSVEKTSIQDIINMNNSLRKQREKEQTENWKNSVRATNAIKTQNAELAKRNQILAKSKTDRESKISKDLTQSMIAQVNAIGKTNDGLRQMSSYYSQLEQSSKKIETQLQREKAAREKAISKQLTGQMRESVNAIGKQSDAIKKLNTYYAQLEKSTAKEAENARKSALAQAKLSGAYAQLIAKQKQAKTTLQNLIASHGVANTKTIQAQRAYDKLTAKVNQANRATSNFAKTGLGGLVSGFRNLLGAFGIFGGVTMIARLVKNMYELSKTLDAQRFTLKAVTENYYESAEATEFLSRVSNAYGTDLIKTTERYIKFYTAAKQSNVALKDTERIFETTTKAAGVLGLKTHELQGVYLALEQMLSKGKVTTEELRRQLGERLPGAFGIMADALDVSTSKLDKMLKAGEVISSEALPKFADALEEAYGLDKVDKVDTLVAAQNRLKNSWVEYVDGVSQSSGKLINIFNYLSKNLGSIINIVIKITKAFLAYKATVIAVNIISKAYIVTSGFLTASYLSLTKGIKSATLSTNLFTKALRANPIGMIAGVLGVATAAFILYKDAVSESEKALAKMKEENDKLTLSIIDGSIAVVQSKIDMAQNSKDKIKILDEEIKQRKDGTYDMYDSLDVIQKKSQEESYLNDLESASKKKEVWNKYYRDLKLFSEGKIEEAPKLPTEKINNKEQAALKPLNLEEEAQKEIIRRLTLLRSSFLNKTKEEEDKDASKREKQKIDDAYGLQRTLLEIELDRLQDIMDDEEKILGIRLDANEEYFKVKTKLIDLEAKYETNNAKDREDKKKEIKAESEREMEVSEAKYLDNIDKITSNWISKYKTRYEQLLDSFEEKRKAEITAFRNDLIKQGLTREEIEEAVNKKKDELYKEDLKNFIDAEVRKLEILKATARTEEERLSIQSKINELYSQMSILNLPDEEKIKSTSDALKSVFGQFKSELFSNAGFDFLGGILTDLDGFTAKIDALSEDDKWKGYFVSIAEVAQETFNFLNSQQDYYFERQYERLEQQKNIAIQFAGDSATAKEEIERQYDAKRKQIEREQAKAKKKSAVFNILIDTAQAVVGFLADPGGPQGVGLSIAAGVIGAAQAAIVASTNVPEFFRGTMNAPEGWAMVDEKQPEIHTDRQGNIKSFGEQGANMRYLSAGDKIYKSHDEWLKTEYKDVLNQNGMLEYNGMMEMVMPSINIEQGLKKEDFVREIRSMKDAIMNKETSVTNIDKNGFHTFNTKNGIKKNRLNNILRIKGGIV